VQRYPVAAAVSVAAVLRGPRRLAVVAAVTDHAVYLDTGDRDCPAVCLVTPDAVRVELVGATDAARDALRQSLPDLRRDLAATGLSSDVQLGDPGSGASGSAGDGGRSPQSTRTGTGPVTPATADRPEPVPTERRPR